MPGHFNIAMLQEVLTLQEVVNRQGEQACYEKCTLASAVAAKLLTDEDSRDMVLD